MKKRTLSRIGTFTSILSIMGGFTLPATTALAVSPQAVTQEEVASQELSSQDTSIIEETDNSSENTEITEETTSDNVEQDEQPLIPPTITFPEINPSEESANETTSPSTDPTESVKPENVLPKDATTFGAEGDHSYVLSNADFDNQMWLIEILNYNLSGKGKSKIGQGATVEDLGVITSIGSTKYGVAVTGTSYVPAGIKYLWALTNLYIQDDSTRNIYFDSELPEEVGMLPQLNWLQIQNTRLTGDLPESLRGNTVLKNVYIIGSTKFTVNWDILTSLSNLTGLRLTNMAQTGELPSDLFLKLNNLSSLWLGGNTYYGPLPEGINQLNSSNMMFNIIGNQFSLNQATKPSKVTFNGTDSLIAGVGQVKLAGKTQMITTDGKIKPFSNDAAESFDLRLEKNGTKVATLGERAYQIIDKDTGAELYSGRLTMDGSVDNSGVEFQLPERKAVTNLQVIFDSSPLSPNNVIDIRLDQVVMPEDFDNQTWIIDAINQAYSDSSGASGIDGTSSAFGHRIGETLTFSELALLTKLVPQEATVNGSIPSGVKYLTGLKEFTLKNQPNIVGTLPTELGELPALETLILDGTPFSGPFPEMISQMSTLTKLTLANSAFSGEIPANLATSLPNLTDLSLAGNQFSGQVPAIFTGGALQNVDLSNNKLVGNIPIDAGNTSVKLTISNNQVTYDSSSTPGFIAGDYANTMIQTAGQLKLAGSATVYTAEPTFQPFASQELGLGLLNTSTQGAEALWAGHQFEITDSDTGQILYSGPWDESVSIPKATEPAKYQVVMDGAPNNPNNLFEFTLTAGELTFTNVPSELVFPTTIISGSEKIVNRSDKQWAIDVEDSRAKKTNYTINVSIAKELTDVQDSSKLLKDSLVYIDDNFGEHFLNSFSYPVFNYNANNESGVLEKNYSWNEDQGINLKLAPHNAILGNYEGQLIFSLEQAP